MYLSIEVLLLLDQEGADRWSGCFPSVWASRRSLSCPPIITLHMQTTADKGAGFWVFTAQDWTARFYKVCDGLLVVWRSMSERAFTCGHSKNGRRRHVIAHVSVYIHWI